MAAPRKSPPKPVDAPVVKTPVLEAPFVDTSPAISEPVVATVAEVPVVAPVEVVLRTTADQTISGAREAQEQFRKIVEQGLAQSRAAYDKVKGAAEEATGSLETSYAAATKGIGDINAKAIDVIKEHSDATLDHIKALMSAKSAAEAIAMQSAHVRAQFEALNARSKEFSDMARKIADDATAPLKATFGKSFAA